MEMLRENNDNDHDDLLELCDINLDHIMDNLRNRYDLSLFPVFSLIIITFVRLDMNDGSITHRLLNQPWYRSIRTAATPNACMEMITLKCIVVPPPIPPTTIYVRIFLP